MGRSDLGSNRAKMESNRAKKHGKEIMWFVGFSWFLSVRLMFVGGFELFRNGSFMIPDGFQYFLGHFWNFDKCDQMSTPGPLIYYKNTWKSIRKTMDAFLRNMMFCEYGYLKTRFSDTLYTNIFEYLCFSRIFVFWGSRFKIFCKNNCGITK